MTVSKVLRGQTKGVRADAAERSRRIRRIARQLGYRPNAAARQMRSRRFGAAGIISRQTIGLFHFNMVKGVMRGLAAHNMHTIQAEIDFARAVDPSQGPRILRELCVDGLIVDDAKDIDPGLMDQLTDMAVPAVFVNTDGEHDCVNPDDRDAAKRLTRAVLAAGHRRIGHIGSFDDQSYGHYSGPERAVSTSAVLESAGVQAQRFEQQAVRTIDEAEQLLIDHPAMTAWIADGAREAQRLYIAAQRLRRAVPEDLSIVTFRNMKPADDEVIPLMAMENPMIDVGIAAADMLVRKIENPAERLPVQRIPWIGPHGRTLAPPPEAPDFCPPTGDATVAPANDNVTHRPSVSVDASDTSHEGE